MTPHTTGSQLQSKILAHIKKNKDMVAYKIEVANERGVPDILMCYKSRFIAFEIKGKGDTLKPIQEAQIERILNAGGKAFVINDFDRFLTIINALSLYAND